LRALTEAAQSRLTYISGARDDIPLDIYSTDHSAISYEQQAEKAFEADAELPGTMDGVLAVIVKKLVDAGFEQVLYRTYTPDSTPFTVVSVLVPGLLLNEADHFFPTKDVL
jgi:ribosomal protein S12 methylthiotransferase accessory factor